MKREIVSHFPDFNWVEVRYCGLINGSDDAIVFSIHGLKDAMYNTMIECKIGIDYLDTKLNNYYLKKDCGSIDYDAEKVKDGISVAMFAEKYGSRYWKHIERVLGDRIADDFRELEKLFFENYKEKKPDFVME